MLRCTLSGLIPLMMSNKYSLQSEALFQKHRSRVDDIMDHESWYLLEFLPDWILEELLLPRLDGIISKQKKNGTWKIKDTERITYQMLHLFKRFKVLDKVKYSPLDYLKDQSDLYSLLIRRDIYDAPNASDAGEIAKMMEDIKTQQLENGSWENTIISTVIYMEQLLDLGADKRDISIKRGMQFLFANFHGQVQGIHTTDPYGFTAKNMFTTGDRNLEFEAACRLKPEWLPRNVCFRHLAIIQNSVCMMLLLRLGMEQDERVEAALDNIYALLEEHGGLCATNIKKPYMEKHK